jgi:Co/Zn/Cd efflux system component
MPTNINPVKTLYCTSEQKGLKLPIVINELHTKIWTLDDTEHLLTATCRRSPDEQHYPTDNLFFHRLVAEVHVFEGCTLLPVGLSVLFV